MQIGVIGLGRMGGNISRRLMKAGGCFVFRHLVLKRINRDRDQMTTINAKYHPNIDYDFRPASYWAVPSTPLEIALRNVKAENGGN